MDAACTYKVVRVGRLRKEEEEGFLADPEEVFHFFFTSPEVLKLYEAIEEIKSTIGVEVAPQYLWYILCLFTEYVQKVPLEHKIYTRYNIIFNFFSADWPRPNLKLLFHLTNNDHPEKKGN